MKIFWAIIGLLVIATVGVVFLGGGSGTPTPSTPVGTPIEIEEPETTPPVAAPVAERPVETLSRDPEPEPVVTELETDPVDMAADEADPASTADATRAEPVVDTADELLAEGEDATPVDDASLDELLNIEPETTTEVASDVTDAADEAIDDATDELAESTTDVEAEDGLTPDVSELVRTPDNANPPSLTGTTGGPAGEHGGPGHNANPVEPEIPPADPDATAEQSIEKNDDGDLLIDGRYVVKGEGTKESPYIIPWELILTARDTYRPRLGKKEIPQGIEHLDGSWVQVQGYMLLPLMGTDIRELLLMRNQWDGCCIGVPPTPYDAIEVKLIDVPTKLSRWRVNFGSITGRFKVDPYVRKDWLLSLYVLEDGVVQVTGF